MALQNDITDLKSQLARAKAETEKRASDLNSDLKSEHQKLIKARDARLREANFKIEKMTAKAAKKRIERRKRRGSKKMQRRTRRLHRSKKICEKWNARSLELKKKNLLSGLNEKKKEVEDKEGKKREASCTQERGRGQAKGGQQKVSDLLLIQIIFSAFFLTLVLGTSNPSRCRQT